MKQSVTFYQRESFVYFVAALGSILLSAWINLHASVVNPDAICYVLSADTFGKTGLHDAMHLCQQARWPLYSILLYTFAKITTLSYITSAYVIDNIFTAISVMVFIAIVKTLGASRRVLWLAAFVILFAHQFNSVRQYIVRDHAFWAFYLISIWALLRFFQRFTWQAAFAWSTSLLIAMLFRIEGALFLVFIPFVALFNGRVSFRRRVMHVGLLYLPVLIISIVVAAWLLLHPEQTLAKLGRVNEVWQQVQHGLTLLSDRFAKIQTALVQYVLPQESARDVGLVFGLTMVVWYMLLVINNLSWIYTALVGYAWKSRAVIFTHMAWFVLVGYLLVNLFITASFFGEQLYLAKRYLIAFTLVLMCWVPFALDQLWLRYRTLFWLSILTIIISTAGVILAMRDSKAHIAEAGAWLAQHVPTNASLYVNDEQLMFYSQHFNNSIFNVGSHYRRPHAIGNGKWKQYDYVALLVGKDAQDDETRMVMREMTIAPVATFKNITGNSVIVIYQVQGRQ